ncbi:hypothetical protein VII00023_12713, partial [Vibrio ichthyoenteri ATCC 700023]
GDNEKDVVADGVHTHQITAKLVDKNNNAIKGVKVLFGSTTKGTTVSPVSDGKVDDKGEATALIMSTVAGYSQVTAAVEGKSSSVSVKFVSMPTITQFLLNGELSDGELYIPETVKMEKATIQLSQKVSGVSVQVHIKYSSGDKITKEYQTNDQGVVDFQYPVDGSRIDFEATVNEVGDVSENHVLVYKRLELINVGHKKVLPRNGSVTYVLYYVGDNFKTMVSDKLWTLKINNKSTLSADFFVDGHIVKFGDTGNYHVQVVAIGNKYSNKSQFDWFDVKSIKVQLYSGGAYTGYICTRTKYDQQENCHYSQGAGTYSDVFEIYTADEDFEYYVGVVAGSWTGWRTSPGVSSVLFSSYGGGLNPWVSDDATEYAPVMWRN